MGGKSKHVLCMHHHNIAYSSRCGKNMSRFQIGDSTAGHVFSRKAGSRSEPSGMVYAPMNMARTSRATAPRRRTHGGERHLRSPQLLAAALCGSALMTETLGSMRAATTLR